MAEEEEISRDSGWRSGDGGDKLAAREHLDVGVLLDMDKPAERITVSRLPAPLRLRLVPVKLLEVPTFTPLIFHCARLAPWCGSRYKVCAGTWVSKLARRGMLKTKGAGPGQGGDTVANARETNGQGAQRY